jgi:hypothetical protein
MHCYTMIHTIVNVGPIILTAKAAKEVFNKQTLNGATSTLINNHFRMTFAGTWFLIIFCNVSRREIENEMMLGVIFERV